MGNLIISKLSIICNNHIFDQYLRFIQNNKSGYSLGESFGLKKTKAYISEKCDAPIR